MGFIAFASAKGSPGVTTTIAALAATWPAERDLYLAELDPAGGDLVVRFEMATEPGLVGLAAAGRRGLDAETFVSHTQHLPTGTATDNGGPARRVLLGPVAAEQAQAALSALRISLPRALSSLEADVLVDCGRLDPGSPVEELACKADLLVMVARPVLTEVHHLAARLAGLRPQALSLLVVGDAPYSVGEVAQTVRAAPLGTLPIDDRAAAALTTGHPNPNSALRRSRLLRSARLVAEGLAEWLVQPTPGAAASPAAGSAQVAGVPAPPPQPSGDEPAPVPATQPGPSPSSPPPPHRDGTRAAPPPPVPGPAPAPGPAAGPERAPAMPPPPPPPPGPPSASPPGRGPVTTPHTSGRIHLPVPPRQGRGMDPPPDLLAPPEVYVPADATPPDGTEAPGARHFRRNNNNEEAGR